jgi:putative phosphoribosyl transferase
MMFKSRENAANLLLSKLQHYKDKNVIIAGIPRGAMPIARILANGLGGELTAVLVHKIPSPLSEELAMGCVGISGHVYFFSSRAGGEISSSYIDLQTQEQLKKLKRRQEFYALAQTNFKDRTVIIVDDGIATGATTICAVHEVRSYSPRKIVLATPVASSDSAKILRPLVDEFITLYLAQNMLSIGQFYNSFPQVQDEQVVQLLHESEGPSVNQSP